MDTSAGKRLSNAKLRTELAYTIQHPDLFTALEALEAAGIQKMPKDPRHAG
ncbi:MAG TPA: hypothetical protein VJ692_11105 [Nitrospiraceae bacterium]|nr:hypothetical protein [Nitrospiraceae bacterium]